MNLPNLVVKIFIMSESLSNKDIKMDCRNNVVKETGKRHKSKWFRAPMNDNDKLAYEKLFIMSMKKNVHYVNEKMALMSLNVDHSRFQDQIYFKSPDKSKEYLWINYLIKNEYKVISGIYNHDDGVIMFTAPNRDRSTVDKCDTKPHYVLCSVDKLNSVLYSFDGDGGVSTLIQHWVSFPKNNLKKNEV